jgi:hypothetical protein
LEEQVIRLRGFPALTALTLAALAVMLLVPGAAQAVSSGPEIPVNTTTADDQSGAAIAPDGSGGFIVAWQSNEQDGSGYGIYARRFDATGAPLSGEIAVNTTTAGSQRSPAIAPDGSGGFIVAWQSNEQDGSGYGIYARRFDATGAPLGGEIAVNTTTADDQSGAAIAPDGSGGFIVAWQSNEQDGSGYGIYARRFDATGAPLSGEIAVNTTSAGDQSDAAIARDGSGGFIVAWSSHEPEGSYDTYARRFDATGAPLTGEIAVTTASYGGFNPTIASTASGNFTVAWWSLGSYEIPFVVTRRFDAAGTPLGDPIVFGIGAVPAIAPDPGGGFTVAWSGLAFIPDPFNGIFAQRFDASGAPLFERAIPVSTTGVPKEYPAIIPDGSGFFTVAWTNRPEPSEGDVYARRFFSGPDTFIDSGPSGSTNETAPTFTFSSDEPGSTFECQLDGGGFSACSSPHTTGSLADGPHTFEVRATNAGAETDVSPASRSFTVDTVPPDTSIDSGPPGLGNDATPTFTFSSTETGSTFECQLDGGGFSYCSSPRTTSPLTNGFHSFEVRAIDAASNPDPSPASYSFTIDTIPPDISIDSGPAAGSRTNDNTPTFSFSSSDGGTSFECQVDNGLASPCSSPFTAAPLSDGPHSFAVRGTDEAGNKALTIRSFTVDTTSPQTSIDSGPSGLTNDNTPTFGFSASEAGSSFECQLDGGGFSACSSPHTTGPLPDGPHSFAVRATDEAANTDPSPASRSFTVDTQAPFAKPSVRRRQKAGKPIKVGVSCPEECTVFATGKVVAWGAAKRRKATHAARTHKARFRLKAVTKQLGAGQRATLKLRLKGKQARRRLGRLLRRGRKARAKIWVNYSDRAGNARIVRLTIGLRRG